MIKLKGEVEIIGKKNNKVIYYDKGPNMVTYWARHAVLHLLTGDAFSNLGKKRSTIGHTNEENPDGTLISGEGFFHDNTSPDYNDNFYWTKPTIQAESRLYPFMPVKMLLGTGYEFDSYPEFSNYSDLKNEWENSTAFENLIGNIDNNYSNSFIDKSDDTTPPIKSRTVNSITNKALTIPIIEQDDVAITGAIKNGSLKNFSELPSKTENSPSGVILKKEYRGIGDPCFIYPLRGGATFESDNSQVMLTEEEIYEGKSLETKLTFTVVMPEQTGANSEAFYPYNGYTIKEVGLFSDAFLFVKNDSNTIDKRMPHGLMFAKRYITPFVKTANSSFTIRWTIYI